MITVKQNENKHITISQSEWKNILLITALDNIVLPPNEFVQIDTGYVLECSSDLDNAIIYSQNDEYDDIVFGISAIINKDSEEKNIHLGFINLSDKEIIFEKKQEIGKIWKMIANNGSFDEKILSMTNIFQNENMLLGSFDNIQRNFTIITDNDNHSHLEVEL